MIILTCLYTPYTLAFVDTYEVGFTVCDQLQNSIFLFDIFVNFFSANQDEDFVVVDSHYVSTKDLT